MSTSVQINADFKAQTRQTLEIETTDSNPEIDLQIEILTNGNWPFQQVPVCKLPK